MSTNTLPNRAVKQVIELYSTSIEPVEVKLPIEVDTCFDLGTLFCHVFSGMKLLGTFWRRNNYWLNKPFYQNSQRERLVHNDSVAAIALILDCYLGKRSCSAAQSPNPRRNMPSSSETIETDEYGAPFESQVIVEWDADVPIDWDSWLAWYEYEHCSLVSPR